MNQYFSEAYQYYGRNVKVEQDLSNYAMEADLKGVTSHNTYTLASNTDLVGLKTNVDKLGVC